MINWGIIGCGNVTEVKSGPAFNKVANSKLVAVMRRDSVKASDYARRHGVAKWYSDADGLINDDEVNAIYVATPPSSHEEFAVAAINAGKPVYIEKPMALNAASGERILNHAAIKRVKVCVAHYRRALPLFEAVKQLLLDKAIGEVLFTSLQFMQSHSTELISSTSDNWRLNPCISGGGLFHDLSPHQLDIMYHWFGKASIISGFGYNQTGAYPVEDTVTTSILFGKVLFNGLWCFNVPEQLSTDSCTITGTKGSIRFSFFDHHHLVLETDGSKKHLSFPAVQHVQQPFIERVVKYFIGEGENPCSAAEGVEVMKMIDEITSAKLPQ